MDIQRYMTEKMFFMTSGIVILNLVLMKKMTPMWEVQDGHIIILEQSDINWQKKKNDIYLKTGIYRATFAFAGLMGLVLTGFLFARFFPDKFSKYAFISFFLLFELISVPLVLVLREVRYYSLVILLTSVIVGLYTTYRYYRPFNKIVLISILTLSLWLLFNTFAPVFFIMIATIGLSEFLLAVIQFKNNSLKTSLINSFPVVLSLLLALITVYPLFTYFKTFEISNALSVFNDFNEKMYWANVSTVFNYFNNFELLSLALVLKFFIVLNVAKLTEEKNRLFFTSNFLTFLFIISIFAIARIPNFIFTRYIIFLQPFLSVIIIFDLFTLLKRYSVQSTKPVSAKMIALISIFTLMTIYTLSNNFNYLKEHIYELGNQYKGPLDYTIPFIKEKYPTSDTLVIAANYEETSYMYYLKSKVVVGFTGNNLKEDSTAQPHIIAYRKLWGNYPNIFNGFLQRASYEPKSFPVYDNPVNNIPELNFMPAFNHQFKTLSPGNERDTTYLYIRK